MDVIAGTASDDEAECRICRGGEEPQRPLFHPCKCSGSIKYTHEECLVNWLAQSGTARCELCNFAFRFEPLYQPNTPRALSTDELVLGLFSRARSSVFSFARVVLALFVWLIVLPLGTCWTWYALFVNSLWQLPSIISSRGFSGVASDAVYGCLLSLAIVFVFLGVSSLREYIRHLPEEEADANAFLDDLADIDHLDLHNANEIPGQDEQLRLVDLAGEGENVFADDSGDSDDPDAAVSGFDSQNGDRESPTVRAEDGPEGPGWDEEDALYDDDMPALAYSEETLSDDSGDMLAGGAHLQPAHIDDNPAVVHQRGVNDANDEDEGDDGGALFGLFELDPEEVPLEEMMGLRGNIRQLFDNAGTVLVSNAIFLGTFTLIPLLVGRLALSALSLRTLAMSESGAVAAVVDVASAVNGETDAIAESVSKVIGDAEALGLDAINKTLQDSGVARVVTVKDPAVAYSDNLVVVLLGYGVISILAVVYFVANSLLRSRYPRFDTPMTRQVARVLRYFATFVKIVVLILFEFGIFPLGCGWWLDLCTLCILDSSIESRASFCRENPWTCTIGHWFLGIFYMIHVSMFVTRLREILRPELLWFLRNPDDPDFRPFRELVEKPLSRHARRMCLSTLIYGPLIVALVYLPAELCILLFPNVFPLNFSNFSTTLAEVPFANVLALPLVSLVHHAQAGNVARIALKTWTEHVGYAMGIEDVVLRVDEQENVNVNVGVGGGGGGGNGGGGGAPNNGNNADDEDLGDGDVFAPFAPFDDGDAGVAFQGREGDAHRPENLSENQTFEDEDAGSSGVWMRGLFMLFLAWLTLAVSACVAITAPPVIGRYVMQLVGVFKPHDLHSIGLGVYLILGSIELACRGQEMLYSVDTQTALVLALPYVVASAKSLTLAFLWFGCVSLGAGILAELVVTIPFRVGHNETPFFYLHQDWALGFLLVKFGTRLVLAGGFNDVWRDKLTRAWEGGLFGIGEHFGRTWREVIYPVLWAEVLTLMGPYAFTQGLLPATGMSRLACNIVHRYIYLMMLCIYAANAAFDKFKSGLHALHDSIRDDKYLVGKKLYNWEARSQPGGDRMNGT